MTCIRCGDALATRLTAAVAPLASDVTSAIVDELRRLTTDAARVTADIDAAREQGREEVARAFWAAVCLDLAVTLDRSAEMEAGFASALPTGLRGRATYERWAREKRREAAQLREWAGES